MQHGMRQYNLISLFLFILLIESLSQPARSNEDINSDVERKLTLFTDYALVFLEQSVHSFQIVVTVLKDLVTYQP